MLALAAAGYRAVAPDMRGYGGSDAPPSSEQYTALHIVGDLVALIDSLGEKQMFVVAHDWGAVMAWHLCMLRPDRVKALVALSVAFTPRSPARRPVDRLKALFGDEYYICRIQGEHTNGEMIAVKVLHHIPGLDDEQFEKEYHNLSSLEHQNVVRLVGYCHETQREFLPHNGRVVLAEFTQRALCFEFMQNGSLASFLTDESNEHDWCTRYAIIKGICQGLKYLHEELDPPMYHLDLKPANVLLDDQMVPKIADFGLSRLFAGDGSQITTHAIGTVGYTPPEYIDSAIISIKFDIYSLGVVIIKILAGPKGYFRSAEMSAQEFIELVHANWKNKLQKTSGYMLDQHSILVKRCTEIALSCVNADRRERPSIGLIINMLTETETAFVDVQGMMPMPTCDEPRRLQLAIKSSERAPLREGYIKLMLELTGGDTNNDRPGLDLVVVLDVSSSMGARKIDQLKTVRFVVQMLSSTDRLFVVIFSEAARRICPLQQITEASIELILQEFIDGFGGHGGYTNIGDGLQTGLRILADRNVSMGRVAAIMLTSDGRESNYGEATRINVGNVPVYTFGIGKDEGDLSLHRLAQNNRWRLCNGCRSMIELVQGCFHMTCWCGHEFCYSCGAEYNRGVQTCQCVIWDEDSIAEPSAAQSCQASEIWEQERAQLALIQRFLAGGFSLTGDHH